MARDSAVIGQAVPVLGDRSLAGRWTKGVLRFGREKPVGAASGVVVMVLIVTGLFGGVFAPSRYDDIDLLNKFLGPGTSNWFGTDSQGRDILSRIIYGARTSVLIGFGTVAISSLLATVIGTVSGYYGGAVDLIAQRFVDIWQAFPGLIFVIFLVSVLGVSSGTLVVTMGILFAAGSSRIVRSATIAVKSNTYVEAARAVGSPDWRIVLRHILPNVVPIIIIGASIQIGAAILLESSLSFLGYGTPPPYPSWGRMLQDAQRDMRYYPHLALFPGAAIAITVYSFNMFGDALRDVLDPRLRGTR